MDKSELIRIFTGKDYSSAWRVHVTQTNIKYFDEFLALDDLVINTLYMVNCGLKNLPDLSNKDIKILVVNNNKLTQISNLPETLTELKCSNNKITKMVLPKNLQRLTCSCNLLEELGDVPETLVELICTNNKLVKLPENLPNIVTLRCSKNKIQFIPKYNKKKFYYNYKYFNNPVENIAPKVSVKNKNELNWYENYLKKIKTYEFQKNYLNKYPDLLEDIEGLILPEIKEEFSHLFIMRDLF